MERSRWRSTRRVWLHPRLAISVSWSEPGADSRRSSRRPDENLDIARVGYLGEAADGLSASPSSESERAGRIAPDPARRETGRGVLRTAGGLPAGVHVVSHVGAATRDRSV